MDMQRLFMAFQLAAYWFGFGILLRMLASSTNHWLCSLIGYYVIANRTNRDLAENLHKMVRQAVAHLTWVFLLLFIIVVYLTYGRATLYGGK